MEVKSFVFYGDWWDLIKDSPPEEQLDFLIPIIRYGITDEKSFPEGWDKYRVKVLQDAFNHIRSDKDRYKRAVENGKTRGRTPQFNREELKQLIADGKNARECARILGVTDDAIYHDSVWRDRKQNNNYR